jgi:hypothetical protein
MQGFSDCSRRVWGGRLAGQINIWWLLTSPLVLPVKLQFSASLVKGTGSRGSVPRTATFRRKQATDEGDETVHRNVHSLFSIKSHLGEMKYSQRFSDYSEKIKDTLPLMNRNAV